MMNKEMIEEMLYTNPLSLLSIKDKETIDYLNNLIPYSSAFEIECGQGANYNVQNFELIPDIMDVNNGCGEQRYRISNGLKGIICLYNISVQLKLNSELNPGSGIHYHTDCTDCFDELVKLICPSSTHTEYILSQLDTWLGTDTAINRFVGYWFKLNDLGTMEYRLGEMTFEYPLLLKRIIHVNAITKHFKDMLGLKVSDIVFIPPNSKLILEYIKNLTFNPANKIAKFILSKNNEIAEQLAKLETKETSATEQIVVKKRVNKLY